MPNFEWPVSEQEEFIKAVKRTVVRATNPDRPAPFWARGPYPVETCVHHTKDGYFELAILDKNDVPGSIVARSQNPGEIATILKNRWLNELGKNIKTDAEWSAFLNSVIAYNMYVY